MEEYWENVCENMKGDAENFKGVVELNRTYRLLERRGELNDEIVQDHF